MLVDSRLSAAVTESGTLVPSAMVRATSIRRSSFLMLSARAALSSGDRSATMGLRLLSSASLLFAAATLLAWPTHIAAQSAQLTGSTFFWLGGTIGPVQGTGIVAARSFCW